RPIDYAGILARARPSPRQGLSYPTLEDLLLLVVLHASSSLVRNDERCLNDIGHLAVHPKLDWQVVWERAHTWELEHALERWLELLRRKRGMHVQGAAAVSRRLDAWVERAARYAPSMGLR